MNLQPSELQLDCNHRASWPEVIQCGVAGGGGGDTIAGGQDSGGIRGQGRRAGRRGEGAGEGTGEVAGKKREAGERACAIFPVNLSR